MKPDGENYFDGSDCLVHPDYTYWTIGYILNRSGAEKLVNAKPLSNLLPVDEFLPIMFDKHPRFVNFVEDRLYRFEIIFFVKSRNSREGTVVVVQLLMCL